MPEICEVCLTSEILNNKLQDTILLKVTILSGRYAKKSPVGFTDFIEKLPMRIETIDSKGKFMWVALNTIKVNKKKESETFYILNTFGLSGIWSFEKKDYSHIEFKVFDQTNKEYIKFWYNDTRNFGTFIFTNDELVLNKKLSMLGDDYLKTPITKTEFWNKIKKLQNTVHKNKKIIDILMNQKMLGSGLGNYLAPEILYRAKLSPHILLKDLTILQARTLLHHIQYVVKLCYLHNKTGYMKFLKDYLKGHQRKDYLSDITLKKGDKFDFLVYRQKVDPEGNKVIAEKIVDNRTTYWVPDVQEEDGETI
jgi:formamidopyrimidine-DNA glycosylase